MLLSAVFYRRLALLVSSEGVVSYSSVLSGWWQGVLVTLGIIIKKFSCIRSSIVLEQYN